MSHFILTLGRIETYVLEETVFFLGGSLNLAVVLFGLGVLWIWGRERIVEQTTSKTADLQLEYLFAIIESLQSRRLQRLYLSD